MASTSYDRKYELTFGYPGFEYGGLETGTSSGNTSSSGYVDYNSEPGDARKITNLHITANFEKSTTGNGSKDTPNKIVVYNMSPATEEVLHNEDVYISIRAGYASDKELPVLFSGQVKASYTEKKGTDRLTHIICGNAHVSKKNTRVSVSYPPSTAKTDVIKDLALKFNGISQGYLALEDLEGSLYNSGRSFNGNLSDILDTVCKENSLKWFVDENKIFVVPLVFINPSSSDFKTLIKRAYEISSTSLLSIRPERSTENNYSFSPDAKGGLNIDMLLDGRVKIGEYIKIKDGEFQGTYKVADIKHKLSYEGKDWTTSVSCTFAEG